MTPAAYTPSTLARIRRGATAAQLGWSEDRFARVCRAHGIEHAGTFKPPAPAPESPQDAEQHPGPPPVEGAALPLSFDPGKGNFVFCGILVTVRSPACARIIAPLVEAYGADPNAVLSGDTLAERSGRTRQAVAQAIRRISPKLAPAGFAIAGYKGPYGGYRLERVVS